MLDPLALAVYCYLIFLFSFCLWHRDMKMHLIIVFFLFFSLLPTYFCSFFFHFIWMKLLAMQKTDLVLGRHRKKKKKGKRKHKCFDVHIHFYCLHYPYLVSNDVCFSCYASVALFLHAGDCVHSRMAKQYKSRRSRYIFIRGRNCAFRMLFFALSVVCLDAVKCEFGLNISIFSIYSETKINDDDDG